MRRHCLEARLLAGRSSLRVALLAMLEPAGAGQALPRAFLRVGGRTLAQHQLDLALAMDCQRIVCIARELSHDMLALQHEAENAGVHFHVVSGPRALASIVTAGDEVLVFAEGLLVAPQEAVALLDGVSVVLVQPVESGLAAGFERLDINHAAAGIIRIPGRLVESLSELPADCDASSALTRIALQSGVPKRDVPAAAREGVRWRLVRDEVEAHATEPAWIRLHMGEARVPTPGYLLTRVAVRAIGPALLHAGSGSRNVALAALSTMLMALGSGWLGFTALGLGLCALAWLLSRSAGMLRRIERDSLDDPHASVIPARVISALLDLEIILLVVWSNPMLPASSVFDTAFAPFMLLSLTRLLPRAFDRPWAAWLEDRVLLALLLAFAALAGVLIEAVEIIAVLLAFAGIAIPASRGRITSA